MALNLQKNKWLSGKKSGKIYWLKYTKNKEKKVEKSWAVRVLPEFCKATTRWLARPVTYTR